MADEDRFPTVSLSGSWYRLIPSRFPTIDIYRRVARRESWLLASAIETMTNPRVRLREKLTGSCATPDALPPKLQNWNHAPFSYRDPHGSRFLSSDYGVLELADTVQTALAVSIRKRETFLRAAGMPAVDLEMRVLNHPIDGSFKDLSLLPYDMPREERWRLGKRLFDEGVEGLRFRAHDRPAGFAISIFNPDRLGNAIQSKHYKFRWDGERISEIYDYRDDGDGSAILPEQVFGDETLAL